MSSFIKELLEIAKEIIPEADVAEIDRDANQIRLSIKAPHDPNRRNKRFQPMIIQLNPDSFRFGEFPDHVGDKLRVEFATFVRNKREQFNPRATKHREAPHTPEIWVFPPED